MGRGNSGDKKETTLGDRGVSEAEAVRIEFVVLNKEIDFSKACLKDILAAVYIALNRNDKIKDEDLSDLAYKLSEPVKTVCGLYKYEISRQEECFKILKEAVGDGSKNIFEAAVDARYKLKSADIMLGALERNLKEAREELAKTKEELNLYIKNMG